MVLYTQVPKSQETPRDSWLDKPPGGLLWDLKSPKVA